MREEFQNRLSDTLRYFADAPGAGTKKLGISFKQVGKGKGSLSFVLANKGQGYYMMADALSENFEAHISHLNIPYRPRILARTTYLYSTLSDKKRGPPFSQTGLISMPKSESDISNICDALREKIIASHIERILDCIETRIGLLKVIEEQPNNFSYPFPLYLYASERNDSPVGEVDLERLKRAGVVSNMAFDASLL